MGKVKISRGLLVFLLVTIIYLCNYILFPYCIGKRIFIGNLKDYCYSEIDMEVKEHYFIDEWMQNCWVKIDSIFELWAEGDLWTIEEVYLSVDKEYTDGVCKIKRGSMYYDFGEYYMFADSIDIYPIDFRYEELYTCANREEFEQALISVGLGDEGIIEKIEDINKNYKKALVQLSINEYHKAMNSRNLER